MSDVMYGVWNIPANRWIVADRGRIFVTEDKSVAEKVVQSFPAGTTEVRNFDPLEAQDIFIANLGGLDRYNRSAIARPLTANLPE